MKFKYYLRGAGVGVLVTTLIFVIALAFHTPDISDDEVITKAKQLGMIMAEDSSENEKSSSKTNDNKNDAASEGTQNDPDTPTYENFEVSSGENSSTIVSQLYEQGFIDNEDAFNTFLNDNNYDSLIQPGSVNLYKGMTYEEIANQLITKPENRVTQ